MKFHCDRCKTKYSISDDRVRGKILKIRCKNCSAVITVREPGTAAPGIPAAAKASQPSKRAANRKSTAGQEALAGAFKKAVNDPASSAANMRAVSSPVSLDAEWYLSKDGVQEGPFNLEEARGWVSAKKPEDELYCWSEGYDDWLPIEKVSHFRGIRAATFSDLGGPDEQTMIDSGLAFANPLETPKPLFAATMAAVADGEAVDDELHIPQAAPAPKAGAPPIPSAAETVPRMPSAANTVARKPSAANTVARKPSAAASPGPAYAPTEVAPIPTPAPAPAPLAAAAAAPAPAPAPAPSLASSAAPAPSGDLDIGEASRVVDLAALMANRGNAPAGYASSSPGLPGTNSRPFGSGSGATQALNGTARAPSIVGGPDVTAPGVLEARKKRSSLLIPLIGVGVVVALGAGVLIYMMSGTDSERRIARGTVGGDNLGYTIDKVTGKKTPKKPVEVTPEVPVDDPKGTKTTRKKWPRNGNGTGGTTTKRPTRDPNEVDLSGGSTGGPTGPLDGDDLMRTYKKNQLAVKMCYESSLKKNPLLKVPKTQVSISVGKDGRVSSVKIPTLVGTPLGTCMVSRIKRWKFRPSTEVFNSKFPVIFDR